jgi:hypothetical protein
VSLGLQSADSSLPIENKFCSQTDTEIQNTGHKGTEIMHTRKKDVRERWNVGSHIIGYVPIQVIDLSLEEVMLSKHMCVCF